MEDDGNGGKVIKLKGRKETIFEEETDRYYLLNGYATMTPLHYDLTNHELLKTTKGWLKA